MSKVLEIVPYDPRWPLAFEAERRRIQEALGSLALRLDHKGSTSVPGLAAKPAIDRLESLGHTHLRPATWAHTHHVHVVESGGAEERKTLAFRDYLCEHADVAREYEALKGELIRDL